MRPSLIKKAAKLVASGKQPMRKPIPRRIVSQKEIDQAFSELPETNSIVLEDFYPETQSFLEGSGSKENLAFADKYKNYVSSRIEKGHLHEDEATPSELRFIIGASQIEDPILRNAELHARRKVVANKNPQTYFSPEEYPGYAEKLFDQYANAMNRRRSYLYYGFPQRMTETPYGFRLGENYIFGYPGSNLFVPSHFAPSTMKGGVELIKKIGNSKNPAVFSVTEDLSPMLEKSGFIKIGEHPQIFGGTVSNKHIMVNKATSVEDLLEHAKEGQYDNYGMNLSPQNIEELLKSFNVKTYIGEGSKHYFSPEMENVQVPLLKGWKDGRYNKHKNGGKLIPKQQYGGTSPTIFLYDQAKKIISDEYKANKQAYDLYLQQDYKNPMSFQNFIKSQNKYIGEINQDTKNKKNLVDNILHYGEYGDSGEGPSISNFLENTPQGIALQFTPIGFTAGATARLIDQNGVRKTINDIQNEKYSDAALSGLGDALEVGFGVPVAKKLIKQRYLKEFGKQYLK